MGKFPTALVKIFTLEGKSRIYGSFRILVQENTIRIHQLGRPLCSSYILYLETNTK